MVYWQSISTLSNHINALIAVSSHQENGEIFHSAVHSMLMQATGNTSRYPESKQEADSTLTLLQEYVKSIPASKSKDILMVSTTKMKKQYDKFRQYTDDLFQQENGAVNEKRNITQEMFDNIFSDYKKLYYHHTAQRKKLLVEAQNIQKTIHMLQIVIITVATLMGLLIILYLDRVTLKVFDITKKLALHDKLTGLYNRHALERFVSRLYPTSTNIPKSEFGLILLDIDYFKKFNDTYGHSAGDKVLEKISKILLAMVRTGDKVIRLGGEELLILLPRTSIEGTGRVAQKIGAEIEAARFHIQDGSQPKHVTVSIGYSAYPRDVGPFQEILDSADRRLYFAKNNGRNMVVGPDQAI